MNAHRSQACGLAAHPFNTMICRFAIPMIEALEGVFHRNRCGADRLLQANGTQVVESMSEIQAKETLDIRIHATSSDLPGGMAKLMEILDTQMADMYDVKKGNA